MMEHSILIAPIWHFVDILITDTEKYFQADKFNIAFRDYLIRRTSWYEVLLNSEEIKPVALYGTLVWRNYNSVAFRVSYVNSREWLDVSFHTTSMGFPCLSHTLMNRQMYQVTTDLLDFAQAHPNKKF